MWPAAVTAGFHSTASSGLRVLGAEARQRAGAQAQHADGLFLGGSRNSSQAIIWPVYSSTSSAGFLTRMAPCTHSVLKWR